MNLTAKCNLSVVHYKCLEEKENIPGEVNVVIPRAPLITSCRNDVELSPPPSPPLDLSDEHNSISLCKKNQHQEIFAARVPISRPESYSDILLRNGGELKLILNSSNKLRIILNWACLSRTAIFEAKFNSPPLQ